MQVRISEAKDMLADIIKARLVPMLAGSPAVGKSSIVHEIAKDYNLMVIDLRLSQCDPTDILGFPQVNGNRASYAPMDTFPIEGDEIPKGYSGWMLFLDEFSSAPRATQAASYKLVLDRMVGTHHLHKNVAIVCAGNLETDGAIVEEMSTALQSRLIHLELTVDAEEWVSWAAKNQIDHRITSYIKFKPGQLYTFKADHTDKTYGSPRTWEFANRFVKGKETIGKELLPLLAGTLSEGVAREFIGFCQIYKDLPTIQEIIAQGASLPVPHEPSVLFALTGSISHHATESNMGALMEFVSRLPIEFQIVTLREVIRRNKSLLEVKAVQAWVAKNSTELF